MIEELKFCFEDSELPRAGGLHPLHACGTRFVSHRIAVLARLIDRFGVHISHLTTLSQTLPRSVERQTLHGYILKWTNSKILLGCAVFHDILKPVAVL